jgi:hypothetical protein
MKKEEIANRNITLTFDFLRQVVRNPDILKDIPDRSAIDFVQKDIPTFEFNDKKLRKKLFRVKYQFESL